MSTVLLSKERESILDPKNEARKESVWAGTGRGRGVARSLDPQNMDHLMEEPSSWVALQEKLKDSEQ